MSEIMAVPGMRARLLPRTFPYSIAARLFSLLKRGEVEAATAAWRDVAAQAERTLRMQAVSLPVRRAVIRDLSDAVRANINAMRSRTVPRSPAPVVPFPGKTARR